MVSDPTQGARPYTLASTITHVPDAAWTHTVLAGIDGYRRSGLSVDFVPVPSALDAALRSTAGGGDKAPVRAASVRRIETGDLRNGDRTLADWIDYSEVIRGRAAISRELARGLALRLIGDNLLDR